MKNNKNKNCNFPTLRFPEFTEQWEEVKLKDVCTFFSGGTPTSTNKAYYKGNIPFLRSGEINFSSTELFISEEAYNSSSAKMVAIGDILIALYGATSGAIGVCKVEGAINQAILCVRTSQNKLFLKFGWENKVDSILKTYLQGGQGNLSADIVKQLKFSFPSQIEQEKIARFLSLIDERIATQNKIIAHLESLIKGLYSTTNKIGWKSYLLSELMTERKELNTKQFPIYSVSVDVGLVDQIEHLGRSFAAKDTSNYNVVRLGDVVYTKSPTGSFPFGIVKQSLVNPAVAVSPLYGVYQPKSIHLGRIIQHYFASPVRTNNYLHSLIQKGAKNTINISTQHFLDKAILLPSSEKEISSISELLASYNDKCEIEKEVRTRLLSQKSHLLQKLFI